MTNDFIDDFIEEYKNQPCLWQAKSEFFKNRKKRQEAYMKLIEVAARHGEHYNVERTKQKINNLRCAFRHQLKKHTESQSSGGKDEPYCPKRPYFESLMFLMDEEKLPIHGAAVVTPPAVPLDKLRGVTVTKIKKNANFKTLQYNSGSKAENVVVEEPKPVEEEAIVEEEVEEEQLDITTSVIEEDEYGSIEELTEEDIKRNFHIESSSEQQEIEMSTIEPVEESHHVTVTSIPISIPQSVAVTQPRMSLAQLKIQPLPQAIQIKKPAKAVAGLITSNVLVEAKTITLPPPPVKHRATSPTSSTSSQTGRDDDMQSPSAKKVKLNCSPHDLGNLISLACNKMQPSEDDFSIFGKMVAYKLRSMDQQQALIAEKIITDVLLDGQMKLLSIPRTTIPAIPFRHATGVISGGQTYVISTSDLNGSQPPVSAAQAQHFANDSISYAATPNDRSEQDE